MSKKPAILMLVLLAAILAVTVSVAGGLDHAAPADKTHPRDKTAERMQEKAVRDATTERMNGLFDEEYTLKNMLGSESDGPEMDRINERLGEIKAEMDSIERSEHVKNLTQEQLAGLIKHKDVFEAGLINSKTIRFVTGIAIDIESAEIQIVLNRDMTNPANEGTVISQIDALMPDGADWHVVY